MSPEDPSKTLISVDKRGIGNEAEIYALKTTRYPCQGRTTLVPELLIRVGEAGKYYKVDGVDYSDRQGTPLFVKSEHYKGKDN